MIILDTNVVSELFRHRPDPAVLARIGGANPDDLFTTAICVAELRYGISV